MCAWRLEPAANVVVRNKPRRFNDSTISENHMSIRLVVHSIRSYHTEPGSHEHVTRLCCNLLQYIDENPFSYRNIRTTPSTTQGVCFAQKLFGDVIDASNIKYTPHCYLSYTHTPHRTGKKSRSWVEVQIIPAIRSIRVHILDGISYRPGRGRCQNPRQAPQELIY